LNSGIAKRIWFFKVKNKIGLKMIIAHLPAGYILSKLTYKRFKSHINNYRAFMVWGLFGAIAPDMDLLYYHLIDHRRTLHHKYFSHYPICWLIFIIIAIGLFTLKATRKTFGYYSLIFATSGFLHLILDTVVGNIWWFAPFIDRPFSLVTMPQRFHPWWLNMMLHWSFAIELIIVAFGAWLLIRSTSNSVDGSKSEHGSLVKDPTAF
jgi:hypothetical protein